MKFVEAGLAGVYLIELELIIDERGFFARSWCRDEFLAVGLDFTVLQTNISFNYRAGIVRGIHFQSEPSPEAKVVRCTQGGIFDVVVDLRPTSDTYCQWFGVELNAENRKAIFIPPDCAHGFQTLTDATEVHYLMSQRYDPDAACGVRFDDSLFGIEWPLPVSSLSNKDRSWPDFRKVTDT